MFPLLLVSLSRGFSSSGSGKLLNNRSSEAVGRLWHLSPITVESPFPCHRPDQPVSHIYDPVSVVTSVEHLSPAAWPSNTEGSPPEPDLGSVPAGFYRFLSVYYFKMVWFLFRGWWCFSLFCFFAIVELNELVKLASQGYSHTKNMFYCSRLLKTSLPQDKGAWKYNKYWM